MEVQERAPPLSPHFLVTNDFASSPTDFSGTKLPLSLSLSPRLPRDGVRRRRLVPIITSFEDDNFLSAARSVSLRSIRDFLRLFPRISSHL